MLVRIIFVSISLLTIVYSAPSPYFTQSFVQTPSSSFGQYIIVPDKSDAFRIPVSQVRQFSDFQFPKQQVVYYGPNIGSNQHALHDFSRNNQLWQQMLSNLHENSGENLVVQDGESDSLSVRGKDKDGMNISFDGGNLKKDDLGPKNSEIMKESAILEPKIITQPIVVASLEDESVENTKNMDIYIRSFIEENSQQVIAADQVINQNEPQVKNSTEASTHMLKTYPLSTLEPMANLNKVQTARSAYDSEMVNLVKNSEVLLSFMNSNAEQSKPESVAEVQKSDDKPLTEIMHQEFAKSLNQELSTFSEEIRVKDSSQNNPQSETIDANPGRKSKEMTLELAADLKDGSEISLKLVEMATEKMNITIAENVNEFVTANTNEHTTDMMSQFNSERVNGTATESTSQIEAEKVNESESLKIESTESEEKDLDKLDRILSILEDMKNKEVSSTNVENKIMIEMTSTETSASQNSEQITPIIATMSTSFGESASLENIETLVRSIIDEEQSANGSLADDVEQIMTERTDVIQPVEIPRADILQDSREINNSTVLEVNPTETSIEPEVYTQSKSFNSPIAPFSTRNVVENPTSEQENDAPIEFPISMQPIQSTITSILATVEKSQPLIEFLGNLESPTNESTTALINNFNSIATEAPEQRSENEDSMPIMTQSRNLSASNLELTSISSESSLENLENPIQQVEILTNERTDATVEMTTRLTESSSLMSDDNISLEISSQSQNSQINETASNMNIDLNEFSTENIKNSEALESSELMSDNLKQNSSDSTQIDSSLTQENPQQTLINPAMQISSQNPSELLQQSIENSLNMQTSMPSLNLDSDQLLESRASKSEQLLESRVSQLEQSELLIDSRATESSELNPQQAAELNLSQSSVLSSTQPSETTFNESLDLNSDQTPAQNSSQQTESSSINPLEQRSEQITEITSQSSSTSPPELIQDNLEPIKIATNNTEEAVEMPVSTSMDFMTDNKVEAVKINEDQSSEEMQGLDFENQEEIKNFGSESTTSILNPLSFDNLNSTDNQQQSQLNSRLQSQIQEEQPSTIVNNNNDAANMRESRVNKAPTLFLHNNRFYIISGVPEFYANFDAYQKPHTPIFSLQELQPIKPMNNVAIQKIEPFRIYADEEQKSNTLEDNEPLKMQNSSTTDNPSSDIENENSMNVEQREDGREMTVKVKKREQEQQSVSEARQRDYEDYEEEPAIAQANPEAISISGNRGISSSGPRGTALTGVRGYSVASPRATALAGNLKLDSDSVEDSDEDFDDDIKLKNTKRRIQQIRRKIVRGRRNWRF